MRERQGCRGKGMRWSRKREWERGRDGTAKERREEGELKERQRAVKGGPKGEDSGFGVIVGGGYGLIDDGADGVVIEAAALEHGGESSAGNEGVEFSEAGEVFLDELLSDGGGVGKLVDVVEGAVGDVGLDTGAEEFHECSAAALVFVLGGVEGLGVCEALVIDVAEAGEIVEDVVDEVGGIIALEELAVEFGAAVETAGEEVGSFIEAVLACVAVEDLLDLRFREFLSDA